MSALYEIPSLTGSESEQREEQAPTRAAGPSTATYVFGAIRIGLALLGRRSLVALTAASSIGLFAYSELNPDWRRIGAACLFTALVYLPALWTLRKN